MSLRRSRISASASSCPQSKQMECCETVAETPSPRVPICSQSTSRVLEAWQSSRKVATAADVSNTSTPPPPTLFLRSGVPRPMTLENIQLSAFLLSQCWLDVARIVLALQPLRMPLMIIFTIVQGTFPAYQTYSHATILDEMQRLIMAGDFWPKIQLLLPLFQLLIWEFVRTVLIRVFETYVNYNSTTVQQSVRLHFQYVQLQNRLRLDIPALADPLVQDLLDESNRFVNAFASGANTILTPLGLVSLLGDISQIISQITVLYTLFCTSSSRSSHLFTLLLIIIPKLPSCLRRLQKWVLAADDDWPDDLFLRRAADIKRRIARMENLAFSASYKAEIVLFGLADWILAEWAKATKEDMELDQAVNSQGVFMSSTSSRSAAALRSFANDLFAEAEDLFRNVPTILQYANASLGTVSLARTSVERLCMSCRSIQSCVRWSFDAAFDLGAFHCAMNMRPYMEASPDSRVSYRSTCSPVKRGMKIGISDLRFAFPGHNRETLRGINLSIQAGETIAIVGLNGSGKSTLLSVLARLVDFSSGSFTINDVDARCIDASDLHSRTSAIFQSFCKFGHTSVRENTGVGDISLFGAESAQNPAGAKELAASTDDRLWQALDSSGAAKFVDDFPDGLDTLLEIDGFGRSTPRHLDLHHVQYYDHPPPPYASTSLQLQGLHSVYASPDMAASSSSSSISSSSEGDLGRAHLSGGQWQRIAIARALMRKETYDLMLIDEANSALDARGQRELFRGLVEEPNHGTIIFVTHRLEALQWADKVAVLEEGLVTAFGTPVETQEDVRRVFELSKDD